MASVIFKYSLDWETFDKPCTLMLPKEAKPLHVAVQKDNICLWVKLDPKAPIDSHLDIHIFGTGWDSIEDDMIYIGTIHDGSFVWHIFYRRPIGESPA